MQIIHSVLAAFAYGSLATLILACATSSNTNKTSPREEAQRLTEQSREANDALLKGDGVKYNALVSLADDFTLMSPFGGKPRQGAPTKEGMEEIAKFFKNGQLDQELVHAYATQDMVVLAVIERANHVEVGGLPAQDWALRVTLVYRREADSWHLVHRHADPLAHGITVAESALLARGEKVAVQK